jgi:hypothetical protein
VDATASHASGSTWYVGGVGPNNYTTIQHAIDNASEGDTVFVYDGIYHESLEISSHLRLIGESTEATIISGDNHEYTLLLTGVNTRVTGFTLKGETEASGIKITGGHNIVTHCDIRDMSYGIYFFQSSYNIITNCSLINTISYGVIMVDCPNCGHYSQKNTLHHNNFMVQNTDAHSNGLNYWDNGNKGNYWSYYTGVDANGDGIGDVPYPIGGGGRDKYPLMNPVDHTSPTVTIMFPNGGEILSGNVTVTWSVSDNYDVWVTCDLHYSDDSGIHWYVVATDLVNLSIYVWDSEQLVPGEQYLLRVTATDDAGNTGYDMSDSTFTIIRPPSVVIITPSEGYLYLQGRVVLPLPTHAVIVGEIEVEVEAVSEIGVDTVRFYVDSAFKAEVTGYPYTWLWDEPIKGKHTLNVEVYDALGTTKSDRREVWIFNF